jgi:hypothetical protein
MESVIKLFSLLIHLPLRWSKTSKKGIIIEDDCLTDLSFFNFAEELLNKYEFDDKIMHISASSPYKKTTNRTFSFCNYPLIWGWATWRRAAMLVDYDMGKWKNMRFKNLFLQSKLQDNLFSLDYNWIKFWWSYFNLTLSGKMDTWDWDLDRSFATWLL